MAKYVLHVDGKEFNKDKEELDALDIHPVGDSRFHVLKDNQAYHVILMHADYPNKKMMVSVNGNPYEIKIEDAYDQMVKKMGLLANASQKIDEITAPMPGLIMNIMVKEGQEITEGTPLLVLSAMKMENVILSQGDGTIKNILVKIDEAVEKREVLLKLE